MKTLPSLAVFAQFTDDPHASPGLFNASSKSSDVHCLSAVTYYPDNSHSVIIWLATTNENAPTDSVHFKWWNLELLTYLFCMVLKQHAWYENDIDKSVISVQVLIDPSKVYLSRYFQWLGFM